MIRRGRRMGRGGGEVELIFMYITFCVYDS